MGVEALQAGVSKTLFLSIDGDFDTHTENAEQNELYDSMFGALMGLLDRLATTPGRIESSMLDETIVLLASEMGRTPLLNSQAGKDHWPITSCLVMGAGIRGNQIVGGTDEGLSALQTDLASGATVESGGVILQPENIHSALLELSGIDPEPWFPGRSSPLPSRCGCRPRRSADVSIGADRRRVEGSVGHRERSEQEHEPDPNALSARSLLFEVLSTGGRSVFPANPDLVESSGGFAAFSTSDPRSRAR